MKAGEAAGQDLGDLGEAFVGGHVVRMERRHRAFHAGGHRWG